MKSPDWLLDPHQCPGFLGAEPVAHVSQGMQCSHTETLLIETPKRYTLGNITPHVMDVLKRSKVQDGLCFVSAMHITAGIYINDAEQGLLSDISKWIEGLAPFGKDYRHHLTGEDNADAHLKSYLTNHFVVAPITFGKLDFGPWQQIFYAEFDGKRKKRVLVKCFGLAGGVDH